MCVKKFFLMFGWTFISSVHPLTFLTFSLEQMSQIMSSCSVFDVQVTGTTVGFMEPHVKLMCVGLKIKLKIKS